MRALIVSMALAPVLAPAARAETMQLSFGTTAMTVASLSAADQSLGQPAPLPPPFLAPRDIPYPGTLRLNVDATDIIRRIFRISETIPVSAPGTLTLLRPEWLPGHHAPKIRADDLVGFRFTAGGKTVAWTRDPVMANAFHIEVPPGAQEVVAEFQYVSPTDPQQGRVVMTADMLNVQWNLLALYPAGYYVRRIPVAASVVLPEGWRYGSALRADAATHGSSISFATVSFEPLIDSPIFAGRNFRREQLTPEVALNIVADTPEELAATPVQIARHRALVEQAVKLFGARHFDHYDFLLAITDQMGGIGLEHHRSSENGVKPGYFLKWDDMPGRRNLLPHELTHSWNGKYRRGADLYTPDYATPMRDSLLWVYEGQTQYWGYVLQARSGLVSKEDTLAAYAMIAALYDNRPGRQWRPLADTTNDPIISGRAPQPWLSWQRNEDYYSEGLLLWLDIDMQIRTLTAGKKSLDDFARAFFGGTDGDWGVKTYDAAEVIATLNAVAPFDWKNLLDERVNRIAPSAPLAWLARGGYKLTFAPEPTAYWKSEEAFRKIVDLSYSLGVVIDTKEETIAQVIWDSPAFRAGVTAGAKLLAVDGRAYDAERLKAAITAAKTNGQPIDLLIKQGDRYRTVRLNWASGLRYPRLEKVAKGAAWLDTLLTPK